MLDRTKERGIGDNRPPGPIQSAQEAGAELSAWLVDRPVIQSPDEAKEGAAWVERTRIALATMEDARKVEVDPLNKRLTEINSKYRPVRDALEKLFKEVRRRLTDYANAVEAARIAELRRLEAEREQAERAAREAEAAEADAKAAVDVGECADVGAAITEADAAFKDYQKADKDAAIAARNVPVRFGSIAGGKRQSMRTTRVLVITDAAAALKAIGVTEKIKTAILQSAKDFEEAHGELPEGVTATHERSF